MSTPHGGQPLTIVVFGTFDVRQHPRVGVLVEAIEALGHRVIECNEPFDVTTEERIRVARRPWLAGPLLARLFARWWRLVLSSRRIGRHTPDVVLVGYLGVLDVHLARLCFRAPIVLDHMAPIGGIAVDRALPFPASFAVIDQLASAAARVVVWDTDAHALSAPTADKNLVVRVGAPSAWFDQPKHMSDPEQPISVCFYGLYTPLQGTTVIAEAIKLLEKRADIRWTLIGNGQERSSVQGTIGHAETVTWIDWIDSDKLPQLVAQHDICLGIFGNTPKALRVVPNKVYQGAAVGCAIITGDTAPQRDALGDCACYVPVADPQALAQAVSALADDRSLLGRMRLESHGRACAEFSPQALGASVQKLLDLAVSSQPGA